MNNFYVYIYLDPRKPGIYRYRDFEFDFEPFYVGKGKSSRWKIENHIDKNDNSKWLTNKINKIGIKNIIVKKIYTLLEELTAFNLEKELISSIGRKDLKLGPLINFTDGGEGGSNPSQETREKRSLSLKGRLITKESIIKMVATRKANGSYKKSLENREKLRIAGYKRIQSEETKRKISKANSGKVRSEVMKQRMSQSQKDLYKNGYISPSLGMKHTKEFCKKISESAKKRCENPDHIKFLGSLRRGKEGTFKGKKHSEESKAKMRKPRIKKIYNG